MKKRNSLITATALGASAAAIWAGMLVTSSAIASVPEARTVDVSMISVDATGEALLCEFDDVALVPALPVSATEAITFGGVIEGAASLEVTGGTGLEGEFGVVSSETAIPAGGAIPEGATGAITVGSDGTIQVLGDAQAPRPGTAEECAALRPESVPVFELP